MDAPLGPDSTLDSEAGPKGLLMQVDKLVRWGLVAKLLMRHSQVTLISCTLELDSNLLLFKCATIEKFANHNRGENNREKKSRSSMECPIVRL